MGILLFSTAFSQTWRVQQERSGDVPVFEEEDVITGEIIDIEDYIGEKIIFINFWASWCSACQLEIYELIELQQQYENNLIIIGIAKDSELSDVQEFYWDEDMNYPVIMATDDIERKFGGITATPTSFIIDWNGEYHSTIIGYRNYERLDTVISELID